MKMRILGVLLLIAGFCSLAVGISFMSGAESGEPVSQVQEANDGFELVMGKYYINGNTEKGCIELFDDYTISYDGGERQAFTLKVWENMADTDASGKIKVMNQYFISTSTASCEYLSEDETIVYNDRYYVLVK